MGFEPGLEDIERRIAAAGSFRRSSLQIAAGAGLPRTVEADLRGDHNLNPGSAPNLDKLKAAAVLVPLVVRPEGVQVLLTQRTDHLHDHAGQVAFPGGRADPEDKGPRDTALRETEEEVGLNRRHVRLIGELDLYITRTGFEVTPVVGLVTPPFELQADQFEVADIFEVPLSYFLSPNVREIQSLQWKGRDRYFYVYPWQDRFIWGATAGMLNNLAEVLRTD